MDCIQRLYRVYTDQDLKIAFHVKTLHGNHLERNNNRTQNRRTVPVDVRLVVDQEELAAQNTILADKGIQLPGLPQETGPDIVAQQQDHMDEDIDSWQEGIDDKVSRIWRQFILDLFENAPNHRSSQEASHLLLTEQERKEATVEAFRDTDLSRLFSHVAVKVVEPPKWKELQFRRYFPPKGFTPPIRFQNFPRMRYFQEWNTMMESLSSDDAQVVQDSFWQTFKTFKWLPLTDTDRIWNTKRVKGPQWTHIPQDNNKPTVQIGVNGKLVRNATNIRISVESPVEEDPDSDSSMEL
ncbi:hypothetical protein EDB86DRAFT_2809671 [Lactarius hatsudake]|nr:hypothetical protein EDB86DRAFT_2809671 [Lactarius hatsudake]